MRDGENLVVLVHSPLVGPFTWSRVAQKLRAGGFDVLVPALADRGATPPPYWDQLAASMRQALVSIPQERRLVLVGHSGAGPMLPILAQAGERPILAYIFVDAGLPHPGKSQLQEMEATAPAFARELRELLAAGQRFPGWKDEDLVDELPDRRARERILAEVQPRALDYFEEAMPDIPGWPGAPAGYLLFTEGYMPYLERAQSAGWPTRALHGGHFQTLVDPDTVAGSLVELMQQVTGGR